jgi:integral membrane protein
MTNFLYSKVGRLRLVAVLEGISLLLLVGVAVPVKHLYGNPALVQAIGPVHGALFVLFLFTALSVGVEQQWAFKTTTWKVLLACVVPFGSFYIDRTILRKIESE